MDELFFLASKLARVLLSPANLMIWLLLLATLLLWLGYQRTARRLLLALATTAFVIMGYPVGDLLLHPLETRFAAPEALPGQIDGIIVLGGAEQLRLSQGWGSAQVGESAERILSAAELARRYPQAPLIYSGGSNLVRMPGLDAEGRVARSLLMQAGIEADRIVTETGSRNTHENFLLMQPLLPVRQGRYLLVTSAYHMPRAVGIARKQALDVVPYPVDYRSSPAQDRYWDFDLIGHFRVLETAWNEWLGLAAYHLSGKTRRWLPAEGDARVADES